ncbi:MAG: alanine racemase [Bacteroidota bacterium]
MLAGIDTPTLLLDENKCKKNIQKIISKTTDNQLVIRPHFKTHQSHQVGRWFREAGVQQITVSSLRMATYFAEDGWDDITVAFPANILEIDRINTLARKVQLHLCIENLDSLDFLEQKLVAPVGLFIKVNAGNNRSGLGLDRLGLIDQMVDRLRSCNSLQFKGFLGHAGQSYKARSEEAILAAHQYSLDLMRQLGNRFRSTFPDLILSLGDTPTCSIAHDFDGIDEIRPGNFVYYDVTQSIIGSCNLNEVAVAMACPVVAKAPERNEVVLYGGGVHFSKDRVERADGTTIFGLLADWTDKGWQAIDEPNTYMRGLSQEHGVLRTTAERVAQIKIGDLLPILPVHSCMAADLMKEVRTLDGEVFSMLQFIK